MATKKELLKNLRNYTAEEIAEAVKEKKISLYELAKESEGAFTPLLRKKVKEILDRPTPEDSKSSAKEEITLPLPDVKGLTSEDVIQVDVQTDIIEVPVELETKKENETLSASVEYDDIVDNRGMFKRPFNFFKGRIRRLEYWISIVILYIYAFIIGIIVGVVNASDVSIYIFLIPGYWFICAQGSKRCHDRGNSGWYQLIPFYGLWMAFADSEDGTNEYGNNPKSK